MRWQGRSLEDAQKQWAKVFRPLREEDEVLLIEMLAAGWDIVGGGNEGIESWDGQYGVIASIAALIEEINCEVDEGVDWSILTSIDGIKRDNEFLEWDLVNLEDLLSHIGSMALHQHEWIEGNRSGAYVYLLVKKVDRYRVIRVLNLIASELMEQLETARTSH